MNNRPWFKLWGRRVAAVLLGFCVFYDSLPLLFTQEEAKPIKLLDSRNIVLISATVEMVQPFVPAVFSLAACAALFAPQGSIRWLLLAFATWLAVDVFSAVILAHYSPLPIRGGEVFYEYDVAEKVLQGMFTGKAVLIFLIHLWFGRTSLEFGCCRICGYDVSSSGTDRCPECGSPVAARKTVHRLSLRRVVTA